MADTNTSKALGWFSVGLGLTQVLAPDRLCRLIGVGDRGGLMRLMGVRELLHGAAVLAPRQPTAGLWSRVAGDTLDLALLAAALRDRDARKGRTAAAIGMVAAVGVLDFLEAQRS